MSGTATAFAVTYAIIGADPKPLTRIYVAFGPIIALISWTISDLRHSDLASVYDWGFLQCIAWPIVIPWYLKRRYGNGAWPLLALFLAFIVVPHLAARLVASP